MRVNEVFSSLQGEGVTAGLPTVFVRLMGCNLYPNNCCTYCDTQYAQKSFSVAKDFTGRELAVKDVLSEITQFSRCKRVCITGGEPLFQEKEVYSLVDILKFRDYYVEVFTNATIPPPKWFQDVDCWIADIKCPSSGVSSLSVTWPERTRDCDQLKFTVANNIDLAYVKTIISKNYVRLTPVIVSPVLPNCPNAQFGEVLMANRDWLQKVWQFCIDNDCRFSFQLHKLVFGNKKGV